MRNQVVLHDACCILHMACKASQFLFDGPLAYYSVALPIPATTTTLQTLDSTIPNAYTMQQWEEEGGGMSQLLNSRPEMEMDA